MIKLDIISGFLGSGKTTLIKKILEHYKNEKIVVIENEFGEIGIDKEVIQKDDLEIIELQNGCICCSMKLNFKESILKVIKEFNPERIIIEPTGIAMLSEIITMLDDNKIKESCTVNSLITVLDSLNYFDYIENFGEFFEDQILNAKTILLSKTKLLREEEISNVISSLNKLDKNLNIINENWDELLIKRFLDECSENKSKNLNRKNYRYNSILKSMNTVSSVSVSNIKIQEVNKLQEVFDDFNTGKYGKILRAKGFIKTTENNILEFNYVNGRYSIDKSSINTNSKICIIGNKLEKDKIKMIFN